MQAEEKIQLVHPDGKNAPRISIKTYNTITKAILHVMKNKEPMLFYDIADAVEEYIRAKKIPFTGSVPWYTVSVKHHLESGGVIESYMEKGRKMHRLK